MRIEWDAEVNGLGSVEYWFIIEPLGTFIDITPINGINGTFYRVNGPQLGEGRAEYSTLQRAKEVAEDLCRFSAKHPLKEVQVDLRDYPDCDIQIFDPVSGKQFYGAHAIVGDSFKPPLF